MRHRHLKQLLNELPRYQASEGFSESVARRLGEADRQRRAARWKVAILSAAATIVITVGAAHLALEQRQHSRVRTLDNQRRQLQAEVTAIRSQAEFEPVIDLGKEDGVHYILDLRPVDVQAEQTVALQPVFY